jgi:glycosyltransferase involved in cell wall biosynthesis
MSKIYIALPKNISFSVFEALKVHVNYLELSNREVVYLSRNKNITSKNTLYFDSVFKTIKFLRKEKNYIFYGITVFEIIIAFTANIFKPRTIVFWVQGLIDQEDYLSNNKKIRFYIFKLLLILSLKVSNKLVLVTNEMHQVLINQYGLNSNKEYLVLNCISRVTYNQAKKIKNSLCYIGGLSKWQNVDKILIFYNKLLSKKNDYTLHIATFDHGEARKLIDTFVDNKFKKNIKLYTIKETTEVASFLSKMEFGFLIRDNILLNNVASPIKLAEYLSCGVNPIISDSLTEFERLIEESNCGIVIKNQNFDVAIKKIISFTPNLEKAIKLYYDFFEKHTVINELNKIVNEN